MTTLSTLRVRLQKTKFPEFPDDDMFSDWVAELAEMDGHIVGLTLQAESGLQIDKRQLQKQFGELRNSFEMLHISKLSDNDRSSYQACREYLTLLEALVEAMIE